MSIFDELKARGLLAQLTDEEEIKELQTARRQDTTRNIINL